VLHRPDHNGQALAYVYFEDEPGRRGAPSCSPATRPVHRRQHRQAARFAATSPASDVDTVNERSVIIPKLLLNMINAGSRPCA
jgi:hypothetical protein